jgi:23S rRNA-/tRNA-specific pseudouridylate synthase
MAITVLYEDNHLLAVVKPPGILSQEDDTGTTSREMYFSASFTVLTAWLAA